MSSFERIFTDNNTLCLYPSKENDDTLLDKNLEPAAVPTDPDLKDSQMQSEPSAVQEFILEEMPQAQNNDQTDEEIQNNDQFGEELQDDDQIGDGIQHDEQMEIESSVNDVPQIPDVTYAFEKNRILELSRFSCPSTESRQEYIRGCIFSPDGTCILTAVNTDGMHVINLPCDLYEKYELPEDRPLDVLQSAVHVKESGTVYDYCWYPYMNSGVPESCCWLATRQHEPIHMWDAFNGELRCSYRGYDAVDEVECAISVTFSSDGTKVIGGYKKNIKVFNTDIPGRDYTEFPTKQPISCFATQEPNIDVIAAGTWRCAVNLYDLRVPTFGSLATFQEHVGGITYLKFSRDGQNLFSGARKDPDIYQWDMRNFSSPVRKFSRIVATNQRIYFDLSSNNQWLVSGDTTGLARVWDINKDDATFEFPLHRDCCNGVSLHQNFPVLATSSGQYHFTSEEDVSNVKFYENSIIFWWIGKLKNDDDENDGEET